MTAILVQYPSRGAKRTPPFFHVAPNLYHEKSNVRAWSFPEYSTNQKYLASTHKEKQKSDIIKTRRKVIHIRL